MKTLETVRLFAVCLDLLRLLHSLTKITTLRSQDTTTIITFTMVIIYMLLPLYLNLIQV